MQVSPSDLKVGHSYLETYETGYTLFTVTASEFINPDDFQYTIYDYWYSNGDKPSSDVYCLNDFSTSAIYALPSALSIDQVHDLYPELFI